MSCSPSLVLLPTLLRVQCPMRRDCSFLGIWTRSSQAWFRSYFTSTTCVLTSHKSLIPSVVVSLYLSSGPLAFLIQLLIVADWYYRSIIDRRLWAVRRDLATYKNGWPA